MEQAMSAETAVTYEQVIRQVRASDSVGQCNGIAGPGPIWGGSPLNLCIKYAWQTRTDPRRNLGET